jgi:hypothetical protein
MKAIDVANKILVARTIQGKYDLVWEFIDECHAEKWTRKKIEQHLSYLGFKKAEINKWFQQAKKWNLYANPVNKGRM